MRLGDRGIRALAAVMVLTLGATLGLTPAAAQERLIISVGDAVGDPGEQAILEVSLANPLDEIAAIDMHLALSTCCIGSFVVESVEEGHYWLEIDTVGTLLSGCESVSAQAMTTGEMALDLRLTANSQWTSAAHGLLPQGGGVLFRAPISLDPDPDPGHGFRADVWFDLLNKQWFSFSTPGGEAIGWTTEEVPDTNYYMCVSPGPPPDYPCYEWVKVHQWECPPEGCDSVGVSIVTIPVIDESQVIIDHGSVTVEGWMCGDVNGDDDLTISDISLVIDHLFINRIPLDLVEAGNANCSEEWPVVLTIGDISALIDRLFVTRTPLCCEE